MMGNVLSKKEVVLGIVWRSQEHSYLFGETRNIQQRSKLEDAARGSTDDNQQRSKLEDAENVSKPADVLEFFPSWFGQIFSPFRRWTRQGGTIEQLVLVVIKP